MSYHDQRLRQDVINTIGRAINPLPLDVVVHEVLNEGFKSQRNYNEEEIRSVVFELTEMGFVQHNTDHTYEWRK